MPSLRCLLLLTIGLSVFGAPVDAQPADPGAGRFGVVGGYLLPDEAAALGAAWDVVPFEWAAFQPTSARDFVISAVETRWLADAASAQREVVGLVSATPAWASPSGAPYAVPDGLDLPLDDPGNVWAAFVERLVRHYAPRGVRHWILFDAPNVRPGEGRVSFAGSAAEYARLLRVASEAAKAVDPTAKIHAAALHPWVDEAAGREPYLVAVLRALRQEPGAADSGYFFDVLTLRALNDTAALWEQIAAAQALLERFDVSPKAIWLEIGASPTLDAPAGGPDSVLRISAAQQADFVVQTAAIGLAAGVDRIGVYRLADDAADLAPWGLIGADGVRRPAFEAYRRVIETFGPTQSAEHYAVERGELIVLRQAERDVVVMWARGSASLSFAITAPEVGERAALHTAERSQIISAEPFNWPAAFLVEVPGARLDANGWLSVAGTPRSLVLSKTDFFRVLYAVVDGAFVRLR